MPSLERLVENIDPDKVGSRRLGALSFYQGFIACQIHLNDSTANYSPLSLGPPRFPAMANQHAKSQVPSLYSTEWFKNDRGTSSGD